MLGNNEETTLISAFKPISVSDNSNLASELPPNFTSDSTDHAEAIISKKKNERSTLEESQISSEADKLMLQAIQQLKSHPWPKTLPPI